MGQDWPLKYRFFHLLTIFFLWIWVFFSRGPLFSKENPVSQRENYPVFEKNLPSQWAKKILKSQTLEVSMKIEERRGFKSREYRSQFQYKAPFRLHLTLEFDSLKGNGKTEILTDGLWTHQKSTGLKGILKKRGGVDKTDPEQDPGRSNYSALLIFYCAVFILQNPDKVFLAERELYPSFESSIKGKIRAFELNGFHHPALPDKTRFFLLFQEGELIEIQSLHPQSNLIGKALLHSFNRNIRMSDDLFNF